MLVIAEVRFTVRFVAAPRSRDIACANYEGSTGLHLDANDNQIASRKYIVGTSMTPAFVITSLDRRGCKLLGLLRIGSVEDDDDFILVVS